MKIFSKIKLSMLIFFSLNINDHFPPSLVSASLIRVENGAYRRVTVKVSEDVSKCHCDQVIENIKVRIYYSW